MFACLHAHNVHVLLQEKIHYERFLAFRQARSQRQPNMWCSSWVFNWFYETWKRSNVFLLSSPSKRWLSYFFSMNEVGQAIIPLFGDGDCLISSFFYSYMSYIRSLNKSLSNGSNLNLFSHILDFNVVCQKPLLGFFRCSPTTLQKRKISLQYFLIL